MASSNIEIERKFLVKDSSYKDMARKSKYLCQGYLSRRPESTVRVRIADEKAYLTVKGKTYGCTRAEFEYEIPLEDARRMMELCETGPIKKVRYIVDYDGYIWEVDEFLNVCNPHMADEKLVVAEVELPSETARLELPPFVGKEVSDDPAYFNSNLHPEVK